MVTHQLSGSQAPATCQPPHTEAQHARRAPHRHSAASAATKSRPSRGQTAAASRSHTNHTNHTAATWRQHSRRTPATPRPRNDRTAAARHFVGVAIGQSQQGGLATRFAGASARPEGLGCEICVCVCPGATCERARKSACTPPSVARPSCCGSGDQIRPHRSAGESRKRGVPRGRV